MADCISYKDTNYFSKLILDYLEEKQELQGFYANYPKLENFKEQLAAKKENYTTQTRKVLVDSLTAQYANTNISPKTAENLKFLGQENTYTITTGHQLNLFTGPLYFLYKIVSTINLTKELAKNYPDYNFVPVFWIASEDHDFEEINFFNFKENKIQWQTNQTGAVGRFSTKGLDKVFKNFSEDLDASKNAEKLKTLFKEAYLNHDNLAQATRFIANSLFGEKGLIIIDGDDKALKKEFAPHLKIELEQQNAFQQINKTSKTLEEKGYHKQVNPREINLFYVEEALRERIVKREDKYFVKNTELSFTEEEMQEELQEHPDRFSPNAVMRPLYQEVILPNLCYIGGGGELAYWLQLKSYFKSSNVTFPTLLLRNSALLISEKQEKKLEKLSLNKFDLFQSQEKLLEQKTKEISSVNIDFSAQKEHLKKQFENLYKLAEKTDKSFYGAIAAQEQKQINGLAHLEKRLLKAQKRKLNHELARVTKLQAQLFPNQNLQERELNFAQFYEKNGNALLTRLFEELQPLEQEFCILSLAY